MFTTIFARVWLPRVLVPVFSLLLVSACAGMHQADSSLVFTPENKTALVAGGTIKRGYFGCTIRKFVAVDSSTGRALLARADYEQWSEKNFGRYVRPSFRVGQGSIETSIMEVPPGEYVKFYDDNCLVTPRVTFNVRNASANGVFTERVRLNAGEIVYIGHLNGGSWVQEEEKIEKALAKMPNLRGKYVFRSPVGTRKLSPN